MSEADNVNDELETFDQIEPPEPATPQNPTIYQAILDADLVVRTLIQSNVLNEGAIEIDEPTYTALMPLIGRAKLINSEIIPYDLPVAPVSAQDVDAERDRRMLLPFTFAGKIYDADDKAQGRIEKARLSATAAVMAGAQAGDIEWPGVGMPFAWIAADNSVTPMDAQTMVRFGSALAAREGMLIMQARVIKDRILAGEIISNVTEESLWQSQT